MLKKSNRFSKKSEIEAVLKLGKSIRSDWWLLKISKKVDEEVLVAVVVSKKISKKAVVRNKIRRLIYEAVRMNLERIPKGTRMIFLVNTKILIDKKEIDEKVGATLAAVL